MAGDQQSETDPFFVMTYEGHQIAQLHEWMSIPLSEKLEWLEDAQEMADHLMNAARNPKKIA